ncbi:TetR/AcrR family transcriptional regulator [Sphaerotilus mobilis]|uniref:TetR family transcriptional regulator n=1 Tax=Sphaerotilus mobilis TaxID=47994 RepID=A0A4Q7LUA2_9BURK|nr:TetR/AcrR family transcriptional regulator [Sphaerotilus mobilis]RZS57923.1 TetR family transcriptional regulator [Sphaerotilus mobilis]
MPRGRSATYADQHEAILAHAAELFAARGYPGTSMNEVAMACGLTKPALYHYVRDKEALLLQICQQHIARLQALVASVQAQGLLGEAQLRALILAFVRAYADAQGEHRVLTEDVRFLGEAERSVVLDGQRQVVAAFADAVAQVRPALAAASLHKPLTMLLFGMINWMFTWLQPDGPLTHDDMAPVVADLFVGGLLALQTPALQASA